MVLLILFLLATSFAVRIGGAEEDRTPDLLRARQALSQLSYGPKLVLFALGCVAVVFRSVMILMITLSLFPLAPYLNQKFLRLHKVHFVSIEAETCEVCE